MFVMKKNIKSGFVPPKQKYGYLMFIPNLHEWLHAPKIASSPTDRAPQLFETQIPALYCVILTFWDPVPDPPYLFMGILVNTLSFSTEFF